jgi:hypothetical protein
MPIFIVGFARSGTTLCQKLVSQRLGLPTLPETHYFEFLRDFEPAGGQLRPESARALVEQLASFLSIDVAALRPLLDRPEVPIRALFLHLVGQQIGSQTLADRGQWIEKTPGHAEHLERIHQMFPKGRFICMVRNPLLAFASRRELQEPGKGWGEDWKPIEVFCAQWAEHVRDMRAFGERHPGQLLQIRLEDLAAEPDAQLVRVRDFVGPGFSNPVDSPLHPEIIQPFETWKRDALKPADAHIADRSGKVLLDAYETWRVKSLLAEEMAAFGYDTETAPPPGLDDLHRRLIASLDWYRQQFARRDALMDVKTTRIRGLLNELADRRPAPAAEAEAAADATPASTAIESSRPDAPAGAAGFAPTAARDALAAAGVVLTAARRATGESPAPTLAAPARRGPAKAGLRPGAKAGARGKGAGAGTHAQRNAKFLVVDDDGPLEDNLPKVQLPFTLHGISGIDDNGDTFFAEAQAILARQRGVGRGTELSEEAADAS